jgi:hypothetical protein
MKIYARALLLAVFAVHAMIPVSASAHEPDSVGCASILNNADYAGTPVGGLLSELCARGFSIVEVKRTFLGRFRIVAENSSITREIVLTRKTGEILRVITTRNAHHDQDPSPASNAQTKSEPSKPGQQGGGGGQDDDDMENDDGGQDD